ncbi:MAG: ATP-binding protein [Treponema sp.]|nr:ATP-binding protein [Treponema sp.]
MNIQEKLIIKNFFSITDFEWDIKGFNVLTGGMASGKSLALKLLYFCEQVFELTVFDTTISKELFQKDNFLKKINERFNTIFLTKDPVSDYSNINIVYSYKLNKNESKQLLFDEETSFDLSAMYDGTIKQLRWSSKYIESKLETWQSFFNEENTPELIERVRNRVFESIATDFSNSFPLAAMFIPASRAIAAITSVIRSRDPFIEEFLSLKEFTLSFYDIGGISSAEVNKILQFQDISIDEEKGKQPVFKLLNGRNISSLELSSGQQELLYLLLLINDLKRTGFKYGYNASIFIEEPSAHLFPKEQKDTVEFLVSSFNKLQEQKGNNPGHRFFVSTHSPYLLNSINNLMEKDRLKKVAENIDNSDAKKAIISKIEALQFPHLSIDYVSAYMIKDGHVKSMINNEDGEPYIYSEVIDQISQEITEGTEKLYNINNEIKNLFS